MKLRTIVFLLAFAFAAATASAQTATTPVPVPAPMFTIVSNVAETYMQGEEGEVTFVITLNPETVNFETATAFLNMIQVDAAGNYIQRMHEVFEDATEEPTLFRVNKTAAEFLAGESTTISFTIRADAAPGIYDLVIQLFPGTNIDPAQVVAAERIGLGIFVIQIVAP